MYAYHCEIVRDRDQTDLYVSPDERLQIIKDFTPQLTADQVDESYIDDRYDEYVIEIVRVVSHWLDYSSYDERLIVRAIALTNYGYRLISISIGGYDVDQDAVGVYGGGLDYSFSIISPAWHYYLESCMIYLTVQASVVAMLTHINAIDYFCDQLRYSIRLVCERLERQKDSNWYMIKRRHASNTVDRDIF